MGLKKKRFFPLILKNLFLPASGFWTYKVDLWLFDIGRHVEEAFWSKPLDIYTFLQYCSPLMHMSLGKMLILVGLLKLTQPKPLAPGAGSPAT